MRRFRILYFLIFSAVTSLHLVLGNGTASSTEPATTTLWSPYAEWSLENSTYSGNPFDVVASATFVHHRSGETRTTEMFYDGGTSWKFRFTGTQTGTWTFTTSSSDSDLDGQSGTVTVMPNPNPEITGFLITQGNKFAVQVGEGELRGFLFNVYQENNKFPADFWDWNNDRNLDYIRTYPAEEWASRYLQEARTHGANTIWLALANQWFEVGVLDWHDLSSENPDLRTFDMLDRVITTAHKEGGRVHIWLWGDDASDRHWTPTGGPGGGINGVRDKRLQRYIAARLGPLPGWTMGYGFDLQEWVSESQVGEWARYMHEHLGWDHVLMARGRSHSELDAVSYSGLNHSYSSAASNLDSDKNRPHVFEERDYYQRSGNTMDVTRLHLWQYTLAGGHGGYWGIHHNWGSSYPNPEQMQTHFEFWLKNERFLLDMKRVAGADGYALMDDAKTHYVFYKEGSSAIELDLSAMIGPQPAVAVDTRKRYAEINLGVLNAARQTWQAPYQSDWAIAVGDFGSAFTPDSVPPAPPSGVRVIPLQED